MHQVPLPIAELELRAARLNAHGGLQARVLAAIRAPAVLHHVVPLSPLQFHNKDLTASSALDNPLLVDFDAAFGLLQHHAVEHVTNVPGRHAGFYKSLSQGRAMFRGQAYDSPQEGPVEKMTRGGPVTLRSGDVTGAIVLENPLTTRQEFMASTSGLEALDIRPDLQTSIEEMHAFATAHEAAHALTASRLFREQMPDDMRRNMPLSTALLKYEVEADINRRSPYRRYVDENISDATGALYLLQQTGNVQAVREMADVRRIATYRRAITQYHTHEVLDYIADNAEELTAQVKDLPFEALHQKAMDMAQLKTASRMQYYPMAKQIYQAACERLEAENFRAESVLDNQRLEADLKAMQDRFMTGKWTSPKNGEARDCGLAHGLYIQGMADFTAHEMRDTERYIQRQLGPALHNMTGDHLNTLARARETCAVETLAALHYAATQHPEFADAAGRAHLIKLRARSLQSDGVKPGDLAYDVLDELHEHYSEQARTMDNPATDRTPAPAAPAVPYNGGPGR